jgi:hypothetical protein
MGRHTWFRPIRALHQVPDYATEALYGDADNLPSQPNVSTRFEGVFSESLHFSVS